MKREREDASAMAKAAGGRESLPTSGRRAGCHAKAATPNKRPKIYFIKNLFI
jgi:hypothetical protein